jgi:hypothetical protein
MNYVEMMVFKYRSKKEKAEKESLKVFHKKMIYKALKE